MVSEEDVREQLKEVIDPELDINIVDLGLIYEIEIDGECNVDILMTLTTPGCPLQAVFEERVMEEVGELEVNDIEVELTFDPRWSPDKMSDEARDDMGNIPGTRAF